MRVARRLMARLAAYDIQKQISIRYRPSENTLEKPDWRK
jgi:hypothetical protein